MAGTLADIVDRRRYLILAQLWMLLVASTLAVLAHLDRLGPWVLVTLTFALGIGAAFLIENFIGGFTDAGQAQSVLHLPVAATVPRQKIPKRKSGESLSVADNLMAVLELRSDLNATSRKRELQSLLDELQVSDVAGQLGQPSGAGDVVGMGMGLDRPDQLQPVLAQHRQVAFELLVHRVDDQGFPGGRIGQDVGEGAGGGVEELQGLHGSADWRAGPHSGASGGRTK